MAKGKSEYRLKFTGNWEDLAEKVVKTPSKPEPRAVKKRTPRKKKGGS